MLRSVAVGAASALLLGLCLAAPAQAGVDFSADPVLVTEVSPGSYTFSEGGFFGGGLITGAFAGVDLDSDGQLTYFPDPFAPQELTAFSLSFSGNAHVQAFSLDFSQLDGFNYQFGPTLGSSSTTIGFLEEGIEATSYTRFYVVGPGPAYLCDGTQLCAAVAAVPEPATWSLLIAGVAGVGAALRLSRRRSGVPA